MEKEIDAKHIAAVTARLMSPAYSPMKSIGCFIDSKTIVRATWHNKPNRTNNRETIIITIGQPNYLERAFIAKASKGGLAIKFPCFYNKPWPKKKG